MGGRGVITSVTTVNTAGCRKQTSQTFKNFDKTLSEYCIRGVTTFVTTVSTASPENKSHKILTSGSFYSEFGLNLKIAGGRRFSEKLHIVTFVFLVMCVGGWGGVGVIAFVTTVNTAGCRKQTSQTFKNFDKACLSIV